MCAKYCDERVSVYLTARICQQGPAVADKPARDALHHGERAGGRSLW